MSTEILLPCPHCGGKAQGICEEKETAWGADGYWVKCSICLARIPMKESEKEAVNFWNLRTPLTVIVPPIEWEPLNAVGTFWGKGKDNMFSIKKLGPDYIAGYASMNHKLPFKTFEDANAVCYGMKKYVVDQALEGCNVIPYRDPQGLVDIVKQALTYCESKIARVESGFSDDRFIEIMGEKFTQALKAWEDGK